MRYRWLPSYAFIIHSPLSLSLHFLPKKDMMFPCPGLPAAFLPFPVAADAEAGGCLALAEADGAVGGGSSSEKDSQAGSSLVTGHGEGFA